MDVEDISDHWGGAFDQEPVKPTLQSGGSKLVKGDDLDLAGSKFALLKNNPFASQSEDEQQLSSFADTMKALGNYNKNMSFIGWVASSVLFKTFSMMAIAANTVYLGTAADFNVKNAYRRVSGMPKEQELVAPDIVFAVWFTVEILTRIGAEKKLFFVGEDKAWNLFDTLLVLEALLGLVLDTGSKLSFLRILRVFRLVRVVRVVRTIKPLRRLRTMIFAILNSFVDLMWAFLVVGLILFVFAIVFDNAVATYFDELDLNDSDKLQEAKEVHILFGSLYESMISLWSAVSGGNDWMSYGEVLRKLGLGDFYFLVFNFYIAFCVVGLFNVVTGVFVDSAVCSRTQDEVVQGYLDDLKQTTTEIKSLFLEADADGSGTLSLEEFTLHLKTPTVKAYFSGLGIDPEEASIVFTMLDSDRSGQVGIEEFVHGTMKLKGGATKLDLMTMMYDSTRQSKKFDSLCLFLETEMNHLRSSLGHTGMMGARVAFTEYPKEPSI
ncbi:unnamed protein product [Polarella glacialis]|nr:unnamed protein product [Polarella glacialis]